MSSNSLQPRSGAEVVCAANDNETLPEIDGEAEALRIFKEWKADHSRSAGLNSAAYRYGQVAGAKALTYRRAYHLLTSQMKLLGYSDLEYSSAWETFQAGRHAKPEPEYLQSIARAKAKSRFNVTWFDEVNQHVTKDEILEGIFGAGELTAIIAKPGTAKSVLATDIGCHIAAGRDWHGRKVKQGLVVFFAAERKTTTERRVAAWRKRHSVSRIPFAVVSGGLDLTANLADAKAIAGLITELESQSGERCVWLVLDTLTRTFGGGDQNTSKDMSKYVASTDEISRAIGCHITIIHHSGWNDDRGKGAIDLDGAIDASFVVKPIGKSGKFQFDCTGANDAVEGTITTFNLESVDLGTDANGNVTTAPVVLPSEVGLRDLYDPDPKVKKMTGLKAVAFTALKVALEQHGQVAPEGTPGLPDQCRYVVRGDWLTAFEASLEPDKRKHTERNFRRVIRQLQDSNEINSVGDCFWTPDQRTKPDSSGPD